MTDPDLDVRPAPSKAAACQRLSTEAQRRRTFAIISHPDAGKTTLTEKLLLYGGVISEAGAVKASRTARHRRTGWSSSSSAASRSRRRCCSSPTATGGLRGQPARHPRPPRLLRGHLPGAHRRRRRGDGARRRQGHRAADAQAVRGVPPPGPAAAHVHQQVGPPGPLRPRAARRDRRRIGLSPRRSPGRSASPATSGAWSTAAPATSSGSPARRGGATEAPEELVDPSGPQEEEGAAWDNAVEEFDCSSADGGDYDRERSWRARPRRCCSSAALPTSACASCSTGGDDLAPAARRTPTSTASRARSTRRSPGSCSRCRPTWTTPTATASPSCGSAPAASSGAWSSPTPDRQAVRHQVRPLGVRPGARDPGGGVPRRRGRPGQRQRRPGGDTLFRTAP